MIEKQRGANIGYDALYQNETQLFFKGKALSDIYKIITEESNTCR
jgi:hypothetical protein